MKDPKDLIAIYSEEFRSFISSRPPAIVRKGNVGLALIISGLLSLTYFIRYSDTIPIKAEVASENYPKAAMAKVQGRILKLLKKEGDEVRKGDFIAFVESNASYLEVLSLHDFIEKQGLTIADLKTGIKKLHYNRLGDLQQRFDALKLLVIDNRAEDDWNRRQQINQMEIQNSSKVDSNTRTDARIAKAELNIAKEEYEKNKRLYEKGVISNYELKQVESRFLAKKHPVNNLDANIYSNDRQRLSYQKEIIDAERVLNEYRLSVKTKISELQSALDIWIKTYIITAPSDGLIRYKKQVQENDYVNSADSYFYIVAKSFKYTVNIEIPQLKFGKVSLGQTVNVRLDGYPYEEFGLITGRINHISKIPNIDKEKGTSYYLAQINVEKMDSRIQLINGMTGTGDIIAAKQRLITHIINSAVKLTSIN